MSSEIRVKDVRLSLVWVAEHLEALAVSSAAAKTVPLTRDDSYFEAFASARTAVAPVEWIVPWHDPLRDRFWRRYLERANLNSTSASDAWSSLMPLRRASAATLVAQHPGTTARLSLYVFPFAIGAEIALRIRPSGPWPLEDAVEQLIKLRLDGKCVRSQGRQNDAPLRIDALAEQEIVRGRQWLLAGQAPPLQTLEAFSVVTIVQAEGTKLTNAVRNGGMVHRALQGLSRWSPTWRSDELIPLTQSQCMRKRAAPRSHIVARSSRGRVVWFPVLAAPKLRRQSLGCYHRNLVAAALQTESLNLLTRWLEPRLIGLGDLPSVLETWGKRAAGQLGRLYLGKGTYASGSCRAHLDDAGSVPALNKLRARFAMPPV